MPACSDCIFWNVASSGVLVAPVPRAGQCRRNAPIPFPSMPGVVMQPGIAVWPITDGSDSCGQYEGVDEK
jgi:hypothetical protein